MVGALAPMLLRKGHAGLPRAPTLRFPVICRHREAAPDGFPKGASPIRHLMKSVEHTRRGSMSTSHPSVLRVVGAVAVVQLTVACGLVLADSMYPRWRLGLMLLFGVLSVCLAFGEVVVPFHPALRSGGWLNPIVVVLLSCGAIAMVEGPGSPLTPLLLHAVIGPASRHGPGRATRLALSLGLVGLVGLALLPDAWFGPEIAAPYRAYLWAVMGAGVMVSLFAAVASNRAAHLATASQLGGMREAILKDHEAHARRLETIGAKVAHELKNPLTSVKALLQLMNEDVSDADRKRFDVLQCEVERMQSILQDYLSFSRPLDALRTRSLDLVDLAQHVMAVLEARAAAADVRVRVTGDPSSITGDEERLRGALLNFVGNALEATPAGGEVLLDVRPTDGGARVSVRDSGRGMDEQSLGKLGKPFFSTKRQGTGLGVVIAMATVQQHGGTVTFESAVGKGTTVTLMLPSVPLDNDDPSRSYEKMSQLDVASLKPPA